MRRIQILVGVVAVVAIVGVGTFLYLTRDIAAPTQDVQESVQQLEVTGDSSGEIVFRISQDESSAEYNIGEVLNGNDNLVVGVSDQVAGDILVNLDNPAASQIGEIRINARTFATDNDRRDNTVARFVLQSENAANEFVIFQPTSISGLPESINVGDSFGLQVTGDLTVAGVTSEVTFDATANLVSEDQITGSAETVIERADFNLTIPQVPSVASVEEAMTLKLDFVANRVSGDATS